MEILRDSLYKRALDYMAADETLDRVLAGMVNRTVDPYSAAEKVLKGMLGYR